MADVNPLFVRRHQRDAFQMVCNCLSINNSYQIASQQMLQGSFSNAKDGCHHTNSERKPADQVVAEFTRSFAPNLPLPSWPPSDSENCTIHTREAKQVFLFLFFLFYWTLIFLFIYETCVELVESGRRCWCDIRDGRGMCIDWIM